MTKSQRASVYRVLVGFAVVHSLALLGLFDLQARSISAPWMERLWFGCATLWFLWPIVLALHSGRSARRLALSLPLILVLMLPSLRVYDWMAPSVLSWPEGLFPLTSVTWAGAYFKGRAEAKADVQNNHLIIEEYGFGAGAGQHIKILRDRYGIEVRPTAQCIVNARIQGHAYGYNSISNPEIVRRYGENTLQAVNEEGSRFDAEAFERQTARREQRSKELIKTMSSIPNDSKVRLSSIALYHYGSERPEEDPPVQEMVTIAEVVHWVETLVTTTVPNDTAAFDTHISAYLTPTARPKLEISSKKTPVPVHMEIYNRLGTVPDVRSQSDPISITMDFQIGESRESVTE